MIIDQAISLWRNGYIDIVKKFYPNTCNTFVKVIPIIVNLMQFSLIRGNSILLNLCSFLYKWRIKWSIKFWMRNVSRWVLDGFVQDNYIIILCWKQNHSEAWCNVEYHPTLKIDWTGSTLHRRLIFSGDSKLRNVLRISRENPRKQRICHYWNHNIISSSPR